MLALKIKPGKYGAAIGLLLERGGSFQTRHERTLIVNPNQAKTLKDADLVEGPCPVPKAIGQSPLRSPGGAAESSPGRSRRSRPALG